MVNENKKEEMAYSLPSNSDINRLVLYLIHDGKIGENYIPDYNTIVSKYTKLANLRNIKTTNLNDDDQYPCNDDILKEVICSTDRFE
jgi:hypothetical protein